MNKLKCRVYWCHSPLITALLKVLLVVITNNNIIVITLLAISVVAKKLGCRLKIKLRRLKEGLKCSLCFTDSSPAKNPAGNRRFL